MTIQTIGLEVDLSSGTFKNTRYKNGKLELDVKTLTSDGSQNIYYQNGEWESAVIDTVDRYRSLSNLAIDSTISENVNYKAYTRTSDDGRVWEDYIEIDSNGLMQSSMNRYIQVKVALHSGLTDYTSTLTEFDNEEDKANYNNSEYIKLDGSLSLKRDYVLDSNVSSHSVEGAVYVTRVNKSKLKKIDSLSILGG